MNTNHPIKTGLLSYGMSGKLFHAPFVAESDRFDFVAVVERSKKEVQKRYPSVKSYDSVDALMNDSEIELVIINTPNNTHYEFTAQALNAGKDVLVEKPFVATSAEAKELFELAKSLNRKLLIYQNRRWNSDFLSVKHVLESGKLGKLIEMHVRFDRYRAEIGPKAFKEKPIPASGIAYDLGSHIIDQVIYLFGKPSKTLKIGTKNREGTQVEDYVLFILSYENGVQVYITTSYLAADPGTAYVLNGSKGSFKKDRSDVQEQQLLEGIKPTDAGYGLEPTESKGKLTYFIDEEDKMTEYIEADSATFMDLFECVYQTIRNDQEYPIKEDQIIHQLEVLEQPFWN
ncbi:Gfo/Idh/MocA family oxidoreductase [Albibacterium profundi]|uniref:Gfo/Idh/MocA family oxidoreductase n=1 Tax=Albibacterium profundi TaxID=3134906 RepID=A0ABV5CC04_9SPHI